MTRQRKRRRRWVVLLGVLVAVLTLGSVAAFAGARMLGNRYESAVKRASLLPAARTPSAKPDPPKVHGPMTFLIIGSDSRAGDNLDPALNHGNAPTGARSDVIMLVHVPRATDHAYVISVPRDSYLPIYTSGGERGEPNKINAAFAWGGAPRLVQTLDAFIGGRIDYPIIVDFAAIRRLTDLVGGVDVVVDKTSTDSYRFLPGNTRYPTAPCTDTRGKAQRCLVFKKGTVHLDGQLAEFYVRQRMGLPNDDFDRAKRHQQYLRALLAKVISGDLLTNPFKFDALIRTAASSLTVDRSMPVQSLAFTLRSLRLPDLTFLTMPISAERTIPRKGAVMIPDAARCKALFAALRSDTLESYVRAHPPNDVSHGR